MVGKKGFIRTLEAVIAILLVLGFLLYILPRSPVMAESMIPEGLDSVRNYVLMEFLTNKDIRGCVATATIQPGISNKNECGVNCEDTIITPLLDKHKISGFNYHCEICDTIKPCTELYKLYPGAMKKSVYPGSVFMYFIGREPRYVRVYFWRE